LKKVTIHPIHLTIIDGSVLRKPGEEDLIRNLTIRRQRVPVFVAETKIPMKEDGLADPDYLVPLQKGAKAVLISPFGTNGDVLREWVGTTIFAGVKRSSSRNSRKNDSERDGNSVTSNDSGESKSDSTPRTSRSKSSTSGRSRGRRR
ncbi:MAG: hypothetical protein KKC05_03925, partial [Nanoarchaeota archaeon]|nr:hypothetical protein [Nanoarchaeota archaeon]